MRRKRHFVKIITVILSALFVINLCGCSMVTQLNLTKEQSSQIAEYAAGLLRKYDKNGATLKNLDSTQIWPELPTAPVEEPTEEPTEVPTPAEPSAVIDGETQTLEVEDAVTSTDSLADILGASGFDIRFSSHEVCKTYPKQEKDSWLISMSASDGNELLVVHFSISNIGNEEAICDLLSSDRRYRILINGTDQYNEQVTLLPDSFSQFRDTVAAGDTKDAVLVFEIPEQLSSNIKGLQLIVKDSKTTGNVNLF